MKIQSRMLSAFLAVVLMLGSVAFLGTLSVGAAGELSEADISRIYMQTDVYNTPEEKLASMTPMLEGYGYVLYVDYRHPLTSTDSKTGEVTVVGTATSGEVALVEKATLGTDHINVLFSNPYDVASSKGSAMFKPGGGTTAGSAGTKEQTLMSQIIIQYQENGTTKYLYSFLDAAMRNQISVSKIKDGIRMEYTIGREEFRKLVPRWLPETSFQELIMTPLKEAWERGEIAHYNETKAEDNFYIGKIESFFQLKDPSTMKTQAEKESCIKSYPCTDPAGANIPIRVFATDAAANEITMIEEYIRKYCPDYTFEQMDSDHETTGYEAKDEEYPAFKLALEYSLNEDGLQVRVPVNGLRYNMASYTLENISILPYMGAGNTKNEGYNFYPDGSGSLFDFNLTKTNTVRGKIYGVDYAYHQISGTYQKAIRTPVYGTVATEVIYTFTYQVKDASGNAVNKTEKVSNTVKSLEDIEKYVADQGGELLGAVKTDTYKRGYLAIIEAGESLGEIETYFAGALSDYATMSNYFNPKPKDSYDIADSISVTSSSTWTVVSNRKYTGNIKIQYQLLRDEKLLQKEDSAAMGLGNRYEASWLGMAEAYRDYLVGQGVLSKLDESRISSNIPLYMEVFGAMKTQQTVATIPVDLMTPFTTFDDIMTMYGELSGAGVKNINFKMRGFANGGMYSKIPSSLSWVGKVGGKSGFRELIEKAKAINGAADDKQIGLYPDFDFAYCSENTLFDALKLKKDAIKTIDNRYSSKRQYSATQQKYISFYSLAISPSRYSKFYEKLLKNYEKYDINTMSVASLGSALNSDFDEDDPYNREDSKEFTMRALEEMAYRNNGEKRYSLMSDGGNAYTWKYMDHIINMDLDSSRYVKAACSVPFLGAVLHGYIQFAGTPLNEEGDTDYALLKAIENGAGLYFILSYRNTAELKEDQVLSQYYSIQYSIWKDDVIKYYNELNGLLSDVQTKSIIRHEFLNYGSAGLNGELFATERVLDLDELTANLQKKLDDAKAAAEKAAKDAAIRKVASVADASVALRSAIETLDGMLQTAQDNATQLKDNTKALSDTLTKLKETDEDGNLVLSDSEKRYDYLAGFRKTAVTAWNNYDRILIACAEANAYYENTLKQALALIEEEKGTGSRQYQIAKEQFDKATLWLADTLTALKAEAGLDEKDLSGAEDGLYVGTFDDLIAQANVEKGELTLDLSVANIKKEGKMPEKTDEGTDVTVKDENERYHVTNNNVVAVTYGDSKDAAYKTFLLNYNSYAVRVTYNGIVYTVEAGGYVMITYPQAGN